MKRFAALFLLALVPFIVRGQDPQSLNPAPMVWDQGEIAGITSDGDTIYFSLPAVFQDLAAFRSSVEMDLDLTGLTSVATDTLFLGTSTVGDYDAIIYIADDGDAQAQSLKWNDGGSFFDFSAGINMTSSGYYQWGSGNANIKAPAFGAGFSIQMRTWNGSAQLDALRLTDTQDIVVGDTTSGDNDIRIYFATDGSFSTEYLEWNDGDARFGFSGDLRVAGGTGEEAALEIYPEAGDAAAEQWKIYGVGASSASQLRVNNGALGDLLNFSSSGLIVNEGSADYDVRMESNDNQSMWILNAGTNSITSTWAAGINGNRSFYDDDVSHTVTAFTLGGITTSANQVGSLYPLGSTTGGFGMAGLSDDAGQPGIQLYGIVGVADPTDTTPAVRIVGVRSDGVDNVASMNAAELLFAVANGNTINKFEIEDRGHVIITPDVSGAGGLTIRESDDGNNAFFLESTNGGGAQYMYQAGGLSISLQTADGTTTVFNEASADIDWRLESNGDANMVFVDAGLDKVIFGANSTTTAALVSINGTRNTGSAEYAGFQVNGAYTITAGTADLYGLKVDPTSMTINDGGPGAHGVVASAAFFEPNITETVGTATTAATVYIADAPTEGDANFALYIASGVLGMANNQPITYNDVGGTARNAFYVSSGNDVTIGDTNFDDINFVMGNGDILTINSSTQAAHTHIEASGVDSALVVDGDNGATYMEAGSLHLGSSDGGDEDWTIYFATGSGVEAEYLRWDDGADMFLVTNEFSLPAGARLGLDGSTGQTHIEEITDDTVYYTVGGLLMLSMTEGSVDRINFGSDVMMRRDTNAGLTAVNPGVQGDGALTTGINEVSTVGTTDDAVTLPAAASGLIVRIINNGANQLEIWPASGDDAGGGVDTAITLASGSNLTLVAYDATTWEAM